LPIEGTFTTSRAYEPLLAGTADAGAQANSSWRARRTELMIEPVTLTCTFRWSSSTNAAQVSVDLMSRNGMPITTGKRRKPRVNDHTGR
jgi:hypothetical protein